MKKTLVVMSIVLIILLVIFCFLYVIDHIKMENNQPVVFSTWGKQYAPSEGIPPEMAIEIVKKKLDDKSIETIENLDNPKIEEIVFEKTPSIYCFKDKIKLIGKRLYKITFNTTQDGLLGPIVFYVDKHNGELIGVEYRE